MFSRLLHYIAALLISTSLVGLANAAPIGSSFFVAGGNFPYDFSPTGNMTFNASGDLGVEIAPGSSGSLLVAEQFLAGAGANGGDVLAFQFTFTDFPAPGPFGFLIGGLDIGGTQFQLLGAQMSIDFGVSSLGDTDVSSLVNAFYLGGANFLFEAPIGWADVFASTSPTAQVPTQIVTTFLAEIRVVPEPSTLALFAIAGLAFGCARIRGKR
ncbi:MAG: PEP-CTERM sorting domain-containing protein [Pseudomonadota bacterium]